jgi:uncharacterized protein (TIGR01777 family)
LRARGDQVDTLVRRSASAPGEHTWDPAHGRLDPDFLVGADAVVCLSGAGVGDRRWTDAYKQSLIDSRVQPTSTIVNTLALLASSGTNGPSTFLSASAVGYYGDRGDQRLTEAAAPGDGFLAELCVQWEAAAAPAAEAGVRVANLRTGFVLSGEGGVMGRLVPLFKAGIAGRLGSGRQFMPWISITDEVRAIEFLLDGDLAGPINITGPEPASNAEFTKALAAAVHRPAVLPVPGFALRVALGEFGGDTMSSQRAVPTALTAAGFQFSHPTLADALRSALAE